MKSSNPDTGCSALCQRNILSLVIASITALTGIQGFAQSDFTVEEVLVTAQKRSEKVQDVPISISAMSEQFLEDVGAQSVNDLGLYTPGLETRVTQATQPHYNIRGITTDDFGIGVDPAVAVYVDGVYSGRSGAAMTAFQDIERVEVLKGPQGTLFGKNAAAGAIHVISNAPSDQFEARVRVGVGNYSLRKIDATINLPLTDNLFFRLNVMDNQRDGYRENLATGDDVPDNNNGGARAALLWQASDVTSVTLRVEYSDLDQDAGVHYSLLNAGGPYGDARYDADTEETLNLWGGSLTIESEFAGIGFTSITAGKSFDSNNLRDEDGTDIPQIYFTSENVEENEFISQEFRLVSSDDSSLRWTAGAMYSEEDAEQDTRVLFATDLVDRALLSNEAVAGGLAFYNQLTGKTYTAATAPAGMGFDILLDPTGANLINWGTPLGGGQSLLGGFFPEVASGELSSTSAALYGDMTYTVTSKFDVTVGLRYTHDEKDYTLVVPSNDFGFGVVYPVTPAKKQSDSWDNLSWRAIADYKFAEDAMAYVSVATGYKAGGFNSTERSNSFDEEQVINYELGLKSTWLDRRLQLNAALFFYEYSDLQDLATVLDTTSGLNEMRIRSEDAEGQGLELATIWRVTENITLSANYTYLDTEITKFQLFEGESAADDRTGKPQSNSSDNKLNLSTQYTLDIASAGAVDFRLDYSYVGDRESTNFGGVTPDAQLLMEPYMDDLNGSYKNVNARVTYRDSSGSWQLALYGQNLTDEEYLYELGSLGASVGTPAADRAPPRFYGIEAVYNF